MKIIIKNRIKKLRTALAANAVKLHDVMCDFEPVLTGNGFLKRFDAVVFKFDDPAASGADQMVVVLNLVVRFITGKTAAEAPAGGETGVREKF